MMNIRSLCHTLIDHVNLRFIQYVVTRGAGSYLIQDFQTDRSFMIQVLFFDNKLHWHVYLRVDSLFL